jgi:hypothetical protein
MNVGGEADELFEAGLKRDPSGCGAGWARIAVAERATNPSDAIECAARAVAANPEAWGPWYRAFIAAPSAKSASSPKRSAANEKAASSPKVSAANDSSEATTNGVVAAAYQVLLLAKTRRAASPFTGAVRGARYREAMAVAGARIAESAASHAAVAALPGGRASGLPLLAGLLLQRLAGLGLVLVSATIFYAMTVPGGWWYEYGIAGIVAVGGALCGLPLLMTGRIRRDR